jgi:hypothetical protein
LVQPGVIPPLALMVNREVGAHLCDGLGFRLAQGRAQLYRLTVRPLHHHFFDSSRALVVAFAMFDSLPFTD